MTRDELLRLLHDPTEADPGNLPDLTALSDQYPYCGAFHRLILIATHRSGDLRYASELHKRILSIPNPEELFLFLKGIEDTTSTVDHTGSDEYEEEGRDANDTFGIIEEFLDEHPEDTTEIEELLSPPSPQTPDTGTNREATSENSPRESTDDIVASFLSQGAEAEVIPRLEDKTKETPEEEIKDELVEDDYFTETLARIYIRQGKYDRALRIFRTLNLKYPKKSGYFAEQIAYQERVLKILGDK